MVSSGSVEVGSVVEPCSTERIDPVGLVGGIAGVGGPDVGVVFRGWGEVEPAWVHPSAVGVAVGADGRRWWRPRGLGFGPAVVDRCPGMVGEGDTAGGVGIARDAEFAVVVEPVVVWAETDQIPRVGDAVVFPVDDVMDLDEMLGRASRDPAATVAEFDEAAGAVGDDVLGSA